MKRGQFRAREGAFAIWCCTAKFLATREGARNEGVLPVLADIWVEGFELVADAREVRVDRLWLDVVGHVDSKEAEGVGCGGERKRVHIAEGHVGPSS